MATFCCLHFTVGVGCGWGFSAFNVTIVGSIHILSARAEHSEDTRGRVIGALQQKCVYSGYTARTEIISALNDARQWSICSCARLERLEWWFGADCDVLFGAQR